ncbi:MAG: hypothetical protein ACI9LG_003055 [Moritella dasanensis]|jgi:hypothetical protein|uniref:hypothetical protein n=1 Tax=Moritella dasanensis TaxID=428031 RepID=UPI0002F4D984|nr:hypothetical protein [Moritella dasanensis]
MSVFNETVRRKGQAEEDIFFAKLDLELIAELHKKYDEAQQNIPEKVPTDPGYER